MRDHPRAFRREALRAVLGTLAGTERFSRTAGTTNAMGILGVGQELRGGGATLVGGVSKPAVSRHRREIGRGQERSRSSCPAFRTIMGPIALRHRSHVGERSASVAKIIVDRHLRSSLGRSLGSKARGSQPAAPAHRRVGGYLSGDMGMSTPPLTCLMGPAAFGITSKAKISVGSHRVAQALGMSTTPEI